MSTLSVHADDLAGLLQRAARTATGTKAAGLAVIAADTGRVLMLQRALEEGDAAGGTWEFPGGGLEPGEDALAAAKREWSEETGCDLPAGEVAGEWHSGVYCGYAWLVPAEADVPVFDGREAVSNPDDPDADAVEAIAWWNRSQLTGSNPALRDELRHSVSKVLAALSCATPAMAAPGRTRAADVVVRDGHTIKVRRDRKGRFSTVATAKIPGELSEIMDRLKRLAKSLSEDERGSVDEAVSHLEYVHAPRKELVDKGGRDEASLATVWAGEITVEAQSDWVYFEGDGTGFELSAAEAEQIADALDQLAEIPVPAKPKSDAGVESIGRIEIDTAEGKIGLDRYDDGSFEIFSITDGVDYEGIRLQDIDEADSLSDLLEELAETAAANPDPNTRHAELHTRLMSLLTRAADMDVAAWNAANPKHLKGPDGKWLKKGGRSGVLGTVLDKLDELRDKLSDDDQAELDAVMMKLRELESSDVDDDDLIEDESELNDDDDEPQDDEPEDGDDLVMDSDSGDVSFTPWDDGDVTVEWGNSYLVLNKESGREVAQAVAEFAELPVVPFRAYFDKPAGINTEDEWRQWLKEKSAEWDASPEGVAYSSAVAERTTSDGEVKIVRYGYGGYWIGDPDSIDADDETSVLHLGDLDQGNEFTEKLNEAFASAKPSDTSRSRLGHVRYAGVPDEHGNLHSPDDGKFVSKNGGAAGAVTDKLKLAGRIPLGEGESLAGSDVFEDADGSLLPMALVDGPDGPRLRLGVGVLDEDRKRWAGRNLGSTANLDTDGIRQLQDAVQQMRSLGTETDRRMAELEQREDSLVERKREVMRRQYPNLTKTQAAEVDALDKQIEAATDRLRSEETGRQNAIDRLPAAERQRWDAIEGEIAKLRLIKDEALGRYWASERTDEQAFSEYRDARSATVDLMAEQISLHHAREIADSGKSTGLYTSLFRQRNDRIDAQLQKIDSLQRERDTITGDPMPLADSDLAEVAAIDAEIAEIIAEHQPLRELTVAEGVIPSPWADLHYSAQTAEASTIYDDGAIRYSIKARPKGWSDDDEDQDGSPFGIGDLTKFGKALEKFVGHGNDGTRSAGSWTRADLDVAAWNAKNPRNPKGADGKWAETPGGASGVAKDIGDWFKSDAYQKISTGGHVTLSLIGLAPVLGEPADLLNAAWYLAERKPKQALLALGSAVPGLGYITAVRKALKHIKTARKLIKVRQDKRVAQAQAILAAKKAARTEASTRSAEPAARTAFGVPLDGHHDRELLTQMAQRWGTDPRPWAVLHAHITEQAGEDFADEVVPVLFTIANDGDVPEPDASQASRSAAELAVSIVDTLVGGRYTPAQLDKRQTYLRIRCANTRAGRQGPRIPGAKAPKAPRVKTLKAPRVGAGIAVEQNDEGQWIDRYGQFADLPDTPKPVKPSPANSTAMSAAPRPRGPKQYQHLYAEWTSAAALAKAQSADDGTFEAWFAEHEKKRPVMPASLRNDRLAYIEKALSQPRTSANAEQIRRSLEKEKARILAWNAEDAANKSGARTKPTAQSLEIERPHGRAKPGAVAKALLSGRDDALDEFKREPLRREAIKRGINTEGMSTLAIKDALWDNERSGVDEEAELSTRERMRLEFMRLKADVLRQMLRDEGQPMPARTKKADLVDLLLSFKAPRPGNVAEDSDNDPTQDDGAVVEPLTARVDPYPRGGEHPYRVLAVKDSGGGEFVISSHATPAGARANAKFLNEESAKKRAAMRAPVQADRGYLPHGLVPEPGFRGGRVWTRRGITTYHGPDDQSDMGHVTYWTDFGMMGANAIMPLNAAGDGPMEGGEAWRGGQSQIGFPNADVIARARAKDKLDAERGVIEAEAGRRFDQLDNALHWGTTSGSGAQSAARHAFQAGEPPWDIERRLYQQADELDASAKSGRLTDHDMTGTLRHDPMARASAAKHDAERVRRLARRLAEQAGPRPSPEDLNDLRRKYLADRIARLEVGLADPRTNHSRDYQQFLRDELADELAQIRPPKPKRVTRPQLKHTSSNPDGLDALTDPQLASLATEFEVKARDRKGMIAGLRAEGAVSPEVARARAEAEAREGWTQARLVEVIAGLEQPGKREFATNWVTLAALRDRMAGLTRQEQDALISRLVQDQRDRISLIPEENQKTLTKRDRDAAITFGGEQNHLIRITDATGPTSLVAQAVEPSIPGSRTGKWTQTPVGRAIAQAYINVQARDGHVNSFDRPTEPGVGSVALKDLRDELARMGQTFSREEVDAELRRLDSDVAMHDITFPVWWPDRDRLAEFKAAGLKWGSNTGLVTFIEFRRDVDMPLPHGSALPVRDRSGVAPLKPARDPKEAQLAALRQDLAAATPGSADHDRISAMINEIEKPSTAMPRRPRQAKDLTPAEIADARARYFALTGATDGLTHWEKARLDGASGDTPGSLTALEHAKQEAAARPQKPAPKRRRPKLTAPDPMASALAIMGGKNLWAEENRQPPGSPQPRSRTILGTTFTPAMQKALRRIEDEGGLESTRSDFQLDHNLSDREMARLEDGGFIETDDDAGRGYVGLTPHGQAAFADLTAASATADRTPEEMIADPQPGDRERMREFLTGLKLRELKQWAERKSVVFPSSGTKAQRVNSLVMQTVGGKLDSAAIARAISEDGDKRRAEVDAAFKATQLNEKKARLAALEIFAEETTDGFRQTQARREADSLRSEIARVEADQQSGKVSQPDDVTRKEIGDAYAKLAARPGALLSLVHLRRALAHIPAADVDRVLKEMDRERLLQLEPDPNQKAIGEQGQAAAIWLGGEKMHFITMRPKPSTADPGKV